MASPKTFAILSTDPQRIYGVLFPGRITPELEGRFLDAWAILSSDYLPEQHAEFRRVLEMAGDFEALELVCRRRKLLPVLGAQVGLMLMLAETMPAHASSYVHLQDAPLSGSLSITIGVLHTVWKYFKGSLFLFKINGKLHGE
jgi:hypothetical protein